MGGFGSGRRWRYDTKLTTADCRAIDVRRWSREGLLSRPSAFNWRWIRDGESVASIDVTTEPPGRVILSYRQRAGVGPWKQESYSVRLTWTPCHFGGQRPWFRCPVSGCGRRVAVLYGGAIFACRRCHQLAYPSQNESREDRLDRRVEKLRARLGWPPGFLKWADEKPKGMHWSTYERLVRRHDAFIGAMAADINRRLAVLGESLDDFLPPFELRNFKPRRRRSVRRMPE